MMNAVMAKMSVHDLLYVHVLYKQYKYTTYIEKKYRNFFLTERICLKDIFK